MQDRITAFVWDFDGTIGDTYERNLRVTRQIIERVAGKNAADFPALASIESYGLAHRRRANWREFYTNDLGLTEGETDLAGRLWAEYQLKDESPTPLYQGIDQVVQTLHQFPQGIVSQNARSNISKALESVDLLKYFGCIIGYEEVDLKKQKPEPDGLMLCIEALTAFEPGVVFYIGDHEMDMRTATSTNKALRHRSLDIDVVAIAAMYGPHNDLKTWSQQPRFIATDPLDIINLVSSL